MQSLDVDEALRAAARLEAHVPPALSASPAGGAPVAPAVVQEGREVLSLVATAGLPTRRVRLVRGEGRGVSD